MTSLGVVRGTIQRCWNIRKILRNLCVRSDVTNRDVSGDCVIRYFTSNSRDKAEHLCEYWPVRESVCLFYTNRCQNITASTILLPNTTRISQHFHLGYSNVKSQGLQIDWIVFRVLEKDVYLSREYRTEIATRLKESYSDLTLPLVFINGQLLGDAEVVERMNESGELRSVLGPYRDLSGVPAVCWRCGDYRMFPCPACSGSKVGHSVWHGAVRLRCTQCEETGLVKCQLCSNNTGHHSNE